MIKIEFDPAKDAINRQKHGIGLAAALIVLDQPHVLQQSRVPNALGEERWIATGLIEQDFLTCAYTVRAGVYRVISLRAARAKEKAAYEQAFQGR